MRYFIVTTPCTDRGDEPYLATAVSLLDRYDMGDKPLAYASRQDAEDDIDLWTNRCCVPYYHLADGERDRPSHKIVAESRLPARLKASI